MAYPSLKEGLPIEMVAKNNPSAYFVLLKYKY
jgi:hypothetical protein